MSKLGEAMASGDRDRAIRAGWEVNVSEQFAAQESSYASFLEIGMRRAVAVAVIVEQMRAIGEHDTSARLGDIRAPTMVIHGTADLLLPVENGRLIASLIPGSELEILEDVGHLFFWEQPEHSAALIGGHASLDA
jgi:pimeloyl-ACP methyl ester carboxylesterase